MKNLIKLVNNHTLFVEGASTREEAAKILLQQTDETPLGLMFRKEGVLAIPTSEAQVLNVPYRKIRLDDPHVVVNNMMLEDGDHLVTGLGIGIPDDALRLHCAWQAAKDGVKGYNWNTFLTQYCGDLEKIGSLLLDYVDTARIDGICAQAITHPLVGEDEVGLNATLMRKLHKQLQEIHPILTETQDLVGMWVLLQGYPVVSETGARWVKLVLIKNAASKILVNAKTWKELQDRDEDGDGAFIGINKEPQFGELAPPPVLPELKLIERDDLPEFKPADPVGTVMNMLARDLTGAQHTLFHGLARATAVSAANVYQTAGEKRKAFDRAYRYIFDIYHPMAEGVFDKRKDEDGGADDFLALTKVMESMLKGGRIDPEPFYPFLSEERQRRLTKALEAVNYTTLGARKTAFGHLMMAGNNGRERAFRYLVDCLTNLEIAPEAMIRTLQSCSLGEQILPVPLPQQSKRKKKMRKEVKLSVGSPDNLKSLFEGITCEGRPVLKVIGTDQMEDDTIEVKLRLLPVWLPNAACPLFTVTVPKIERVEGTQHHRYLILPGMKCRLFCPIFRLVDDQVVLVDLKLWFAERVKDALESFTRRMGKINQQRLQQHMDRQMRKAIRELIIISSDDEGTREALIRMSEYRVEINENDTISGKWAQKEQLLTQLHEMGFDVVMTSKNKPGSIVTQSWKLDRPRFLFAINPFAAHLDKKREVEVREIRKALELADPIPMPLKAKGCGLPKELGKCLTLLNVMVGDLPGWNTFVGSEGEFCFDTLLVTASGVGKLALKKLGFQAKDAAEKERIVEKLVREGFTKDQIQIEENIESVGEGLFITTYDIVAVGPVEDIGKIKAAVGPIKGVMNPVPFELYAVEPDGSRTRIDLVVPHTTIVKKRAVDAVLTMGALKGRLTEIDPEASVEEHTTQVQTALKEQGYRTDGKQMVIAVVEGNEIELGYALVGPLPFFRPVQTGRSTCDIRTGERGIKVHYHAMIMSKRCDAQGRVVDRIRFHNTPAWVSEDFAQVVQTRQQVKAEITKHQWSSAPSSNQSSPSDLLESLAVDDNVPAI